MYTNIPSVQILISLLKQYKIKHVVISPGTRNTAFVHSVEKDSFFECYSIVDERSASFFALGIAEALDVPVCFSCTAATATCNYMPAIKEAYERNIQLIALTADQDQYSMFHMGDQNINQINMFGSFVKYSVDIPKINNEDDYWFSNRSINEALLEMSHYNKGPIQINYHMDYTLDEIATFSCENLPQTRKINRIEDIKDFSKYKEILLNKGKILVICGSMNVTDDLKNSLLEFYEKYNCAIVYDTFSNIASKKFISPKCLGDINNSMVINLLKPDLIITVGEVFYSTIKYFMPSYRKDCENWQISIDGKINDGYRCLTTIFECNPNEFFKNVCVDVNNKNNFIYDDTWKKITDKIKVQDSAWTNFKVIETFCGKLPKNSILHTSVLDSIRMSNYVHIDDSIKCYANIGADGIDGALSTFLGQASSSKELAFLLIGDLSFLYDINAIFSSVNSNIRILVINNYGGAEFHKNFGLERIDTLGMHISAEHETVLESCVNYSEFDYISARDLEEFNFELKKFISSNDKPILFEVFTDIEKDAKNLKKYWEINLENLPRERKNMLKTKIKSILRRIKNGVKKLLEEDKKSY